MLSAESSQLFYIVLGTKWSIIGNAQSEVSSECKYSVHEGVMTVHCSRAEQLAQLVLSLIELGVSPLAPATQPVKRFTI